ncbi:hypothetical protein HRM2_17340 [Desulforapulum autotrophicum HRM2]|uniref:DNA-binding protein n=1 Tax=Desulforapulum autotrophicum (strain ATCC 43914 / DSM 3382 / VKM B-1955 / HRM2) TaxID=177437 RepID=C0QB41_DESAH|nr:hypothetical protein [Desulforapulum autotrophicum]ACN14840.1 hypothetical protein HRM2_17340 [Desulforapulum autotrophicum HRM2]
MNLVEVKKAADAGQLPVSVHTIYKWNCKKTHPALVLKIAGKLFFDNDEWLKMAERARDAQVKEAKRIYAAS